jgi:glycolate oxidase iron-sulfur subunit
MSAALPTPASAPDITALADACVRCGLCLPHCPTYRLDQLESESPRGRIALARSLHQSPAESAALFDTALDHCLGCGRCESVCPAGVRYADLLLGTRALQRERRGSGLRQRLLEGMMARPRLLGGVLGIYRRLHPLLPGRLRILPRPPHSSHATLGTRKDAPALFLGCIARSYEGATHNALRELLAAVGEDLAIPPSQGCCGAFHAHAGNSQAAESLAERNRDAFAANPVVLSLASGCQASLRGSLPADTAVTDALAYLSAHGERLRFRVTPGLVAIHRPCTQDKEGIDALRALLSKVPELRLVELDAGFGCCGAAGAHMLDFPERAAQLRSPVLEQIVASGADWVLSANIGCRLHLQGSAAPVQHPLEFLATRLDMQGVNNTAALSSRP